MYTDDDTQKYAERGEDSSYDSECEEEVARGEAGVEGESHRTASRTPSDTLAAEFAEYVTLARPSAPCKNKIEHALRLGYTEKLRVDALQRLGANPSHDELLAAAELPRAPAPPATSAPPPPKLRHIVIDGSNVAMSHGNKEVFSCRGIEICVEWFRARGHTEITVFVPKWRKEAARPDHRVTDRDALDRLERARILVYTPSRLIGGKRLVCYDDRYILRLAVDTDGIVVSNDNYRDLAAENPDYWKVVEERLLMYTFVNDRFMPPEDPLGRLGPTLDAFLGVPSTDLELPPPCPYGKKCTYGNKCKFHHPERAGRAYKPVADRSERVAQTKSRDLHTVSLPLSVRPAAGPKQQLARAHSATPRLPAADSALATHFERAQVQLEQQIHATEVNPHRKLARQLSLNPACDPRLPHTTAARMASAPSGPGAHSPHPNPHQLLPSPSDGALQQWETRRRIQYHLSAIFPEAQVAEAMAAYPEETNAQTLCAIILARHRPVENTHTQYLQQK